MYYLPAGASASAKRRARQMAPDIAAILIDVFTGIRFIELHEFPFESKILISQTSIYRASCFLSVC